MTSIMHLNDEQLKNFVECLEVSSSVIRACTAGNFEHIATAYKVRAAPPNDPNHAGIYFKFHHFALVSSTVDTLGVIAADEFNVNKDEQLRELCDTVKLNIAIRTFNECFQTFPFSKMHGQDIQLFHALERESISGSISFFNYRSIRLDLGRHCVNLLFAITALQDRELAGRVLEKNYGELLSDVNRLAEVDLSFKSINAECDNVASQKFVLNFENFMRSLPASVYHCHDGKTIYSGRGFVLPCDCGKSHLLENCEAVCEGSLPAFAVFRCPCKENLIKVESEGVFRIKGVKVVSKLTASSSLIDIAVQAVASRKRVTD